MEERKEKDKSRVHGKMREGGVPEGDWFVKGRACWGDSEGGGLELGNLESKGSCESQKGA
ncbi:hypothetical protein BY996DRAFT_6470273 [Phakopsora pachyrhizi]|nr:hypothetical protein BY996DRAFT_6470273 [Phakopsora pachyrhizi]